VKIKHTGYSVKTKPVNTVFVKPEFTVGKEKMKNLRLSKVKTPGIPGFVITAWPVMKILVSGAVKKAEPFNLI
jgi:hypothetical protein